MRGTSLRAIFRSFLTPRSGCPSNSTRSFSSAGKRVSSMPARMNVYVKPEDSGDQTDSSNYSSAITYAGRNKFLFYYAQEHVDFRFPEVRSLCALLEIPLNEDQMTNPECPFLLLDMPDENSARTLVQRSVLMKSCYECWIHARSMKDLVGYLSQLPASFMSRYSAEGSSFRLRVNAYGKKLTCDDIRNRIETLRALPLETRVDLNNPTHSFHYVEDYGDENAPDRLHPEQVFFGRWIADSSRDGAHKLRLDERYFIGTTSMDPLLALVMANQAQVSNGSLVYDPFVGTGSLLVAASYFGGYSLGADIDRALLHGRGKSTRAKNTWRRKDESVLANFAQYDMVDHYVGIVVADATKNVIREDMHFDAIVSDPPYGVREPIARTGKTNANGTSTSGVPLETDEHMQIGRCALNDLIITLVSFASKNLRIGGRLVYWLPVLQDEYNETAVPQHPCFEVISNSEQKLAGSTSRRLITMEKIHEWKPEYQVTFAENIYTNTFRERYFTAKDKENKRKPNSISRRVKSNGAELSTTACQ